jgi:xanthine dehydrogenase iron-sulfur cluster and FAD-binding subunit A
MKLPPFAYEAPTTVAEAVDLLAEHGDEASVLAGGQSLIPLLALRLARPAVLIDINGVGELSGVSADNGQVAIGAVTREYVAEESATVADAMPLLAAALPLIGHEAIRSRGTIGGSLAHADPAAELPAVARALDAEFVVRGPSGERVIPAAEWFEGYLTTSRRPDELLTEVRFPAAKPGTGSSFEEVARRHGDFAMVGLAASLVLSGGVISEARLAFAGVSDVPVRATAAEDLLAGERPSAELFDEAARRATQDLDPPDDLHGSSDYRKTVAAAVARRGLRAAADNATGSPEARKTLADFLRDDLDLTGTHVGCEHGVCGACTVIVDGRAVRSCLMLAVQAAGREVTTVEGLAPDGELGPLQQAMWDSHSFQCGFCTPGFVMQATAFLRGHPDAGEQEIREALSGNICRCTGYQSIVDGVLLAVQRNRES